MKVNGNNASPAVDRVQQVTSNREAAKPGVTRPSGGEQVRVSSAGKQLAAARSPEVLDQKRIDAMRDAIAKGTLSIDPNAIAGAMIREER